MEKKEHLDYWLKIAEKDEEMVDFLIENNRFVHALFFGHLYLEKYNSPQLQLDVSTLPPGLYFIKINNTEVRKFIKQ